MEQEAEDDLPAMLAALGVRRCALVGHSDGASIAVAHAAGPRHPSVEALVLVAPHVFVERMAQDAIRETGRRFSRGPLKESLRRHHGDNLECAFRGWHDAWLDPGFEASFDLRPRLGGIDVPSLLVQGLDDPYGTLAQIDALARGVDGPVERLLLPRCGHAPHREAAQPLLDALVGFAHQAL